MDGFSPSNRFYVEHLSSEVFIWACLFIDKEEIHNKLLSLCAKAELSEITKYIDCELCNYEIFGIVKSSFQDNYTDTLKKLLSLKLESNKLEIALWLYNFYDNDNNREIIKEIPRLECNDLHLIYLDHIREQIKSIFKQEELLKICDDKRSDYEDLTLMQENICICIAKYINCQEYVFNESNNHAYELNEFKSIINYIKKHRENIIHLSGIHGPQPGMEGDFIDVDDHTFHDCIHINLKNIRAQDIFKKIMM